MIFHHLILLALLAGLALAWQTSNKNACKKYEKWYSCGPCEGSCKQPKPNCAKKCYPAGCYCPYPKYVVYQGKCIPYSQCPKG